VSDFKAKMHQFDFCWGSAPADSAVGTYSAPPHPLVVRGYGKGEGEKGLRRIRTGSGEREGDRDTEFPPLHFSPTFTTTKGETRKTFFWLYANDIADR